MSTTVRPPQAIEAASPDRSIAPPKSVSVSRNRFRLRRWQVGGIVLSLAAALAYVEWPSLMGGPNTNIASTFEVTRRSFPVVEEAKGELKAAKTTEIRSKVEGRTTIIWLVDEGTTVKKGDLLVRLASDRIEETVRQEEAQEASAISFLEAAEKDLEILLDENASNIRKGKLAVELAEIELNKYTLGDSKKSLAEYKLEVDRAGQMHERKKDDFASAKDLFEMDFITRSEYLQDEFDLHEAARAVERADLGLKIFQDFEYPKEIRRLTSDVEEAKKELVRTRKSALAKEAQKKADVEAKQASLMNTQNKLSKYREQLEQCELRAPAPGLVVYHTGHRYNPKQINEGAEVYERQILVTLPDPAVMLVSVRIHEAKTHKIKIGQEVSVEIDAIPGEMFTGKITKIAPLADSRNSWLNPDLKEYETVITLDQTGPELKPGVTARAEIFISQLEDVLCVPLQSVYTKAGRHYVFKAVGSAEVPVEIEIGQSNSEFVEIASGLAESDRIFLTVSDQAKTLLPDDINADHEIRNVKSTSKHSPGKTRSGGGKKHRSHNS
jgi:HlyD family secretion protein